jgi:hypothetical protein
MRAKILFQNIRQAGDGEDQAVPPIQDPGAVGPNHRRHVAMPFWLALQLKKFAIDTTTTTEYCDWPNLYFLWLQGIDAKLSATGDKM